MREFPFGQVPVADEAHLHIQWGILDEVGAWKESVRSYPGRSAGLSLTGLDGFDQLIDGPAEVCRGHSTAAMREGLKLSENA
jgi:hypothetical protein